MPTPISSRWVQCDTCKAIHLTLVDAKECERYHLRMWRTGLYVTGGVVVSAVVLYYSLVLIG